MPEVAGRLLAFAEDPVWEGEPPAEVVRALVTRGGPGDLMALAHQSQMNQSSSSDLYVAARGLSARVFWQLPTEAQVTVLADLARLTSEMLAKNDPWERHTRTGV